MADSKPINRKQRRAAARKGGDPNDHLDQSDMDFKLAQPDRSGPKAKTLYDIAAEKQEEWRKAGLYQNEPVMRKNGDWEFDDEPLGPVGDAIIYSITLSMLHFTLDVLVYSQYRQTIVWKEIFKRVGTALPVLFVLVYIMHSKTFTRVKLLPQLLFLTTAVSAGCFMVHAGNKSGYFAVMKMAPPIGTLWVWSVIELKLPYALASVVAVVSYLFWNDFRVF